MIVYDKNGNKVNLTEEKDLDSIKILINPNGNSTSGDLSSYMHTGIYRIFDIDKNAPVENANGILLCFEYITNVTLQLYFNYNGQSFVRVLWYGTWSSWIRLSNSI